MEIEQSHSDQIVDERVSIANSVWVKMYPTVNFIESGFELASGLASGNIGIAVDGMHGTAEVFISKTQISNAHEHDHIDDRRRKMIYATLSGLAGSAGLLALAEATGVVEWSSASSFTDATGWLAAGAAANSAWAASSALLRGVHQKYGRIFRAPLTEVDHDLVRHIVLLDTPSSTLAFMSASVRIASLWLSGKGYNGIDTDLIEHCVGVVSGGLGAYLFRPTKANLEHHSHPKSHETLPPVIEEMESSSRARKRLFRRLGKSSTTQ